MNRSQGSVLQLSILAGLSAASVAHAACLDSNTCFGTGALEQHVSGNDNSAFGFQALGADAEGAKNTAVGSLALHSNSRGLENTAIGVGALQFSTAGSQNTAVGVAALQGSHGFGNVALGADALRGMNESDDELPVHNGSGNVAIGSGAMSTSQSGNSNTAVGSSALRGFGLEGGIPSTGEENTAIGAFAMYGTATGRRNTATGYAAMVSGDSDYSSGIRGSNNTADGAQALYWLRTGNGNTAVGADAAYLLTSGSNNTASGYQALQGSGDIFEDGIGQTGSNNAAYGAKALTLNETGNHNTAVGANALHNNTNGNYNTSVGNSALRNIAAGVRNVALGHRAGMNLTTGSDNIIIGGDNGGIASESNVIRIGRAASQKRAFVAGIRGVKTSRSDATAVMIDANGQLGTINSSRSVKEDIHSMGDVSERILRLRPVMFRYKEADEDGTHPMQIGLIAEEVAEVFPELVVTDENGNAETVSYHLLSTLLLNEFQKQRIESEAQVAELAVLRAEVARMAAILDRLDRSEKVATNR